MYFLIYISIMWQATPQEGMLIRCQGGTFSVIKCALPERLGSFLFLHTTSVTIGHFFKSQFAVIIKPGKKKKKFFQILRAIY